ncbi:nb-arc domain-containing protein [Streptomyces armeniacus]|uniref:Nb-arc domain-containing protein n=1 Tax=Streptomyces armeniacus TaxID=83291 RepID=A0A345XUF9_9ACTN|nr:tetratricopeptide repeat protein [Streptomyces armeniacus]AXK35275.1 nb-arc domain-containing protein [Streptomyces armeniacus]
MTDQRNSGPRIHNDLSGSTGASVQAGTVEGGVHLTVHDGPSWTVPRQLPPDVVGFVNRGSELAALDAVLRAAPPESRLAPMVITAIAGAAGVGKTALAVHWAHRARDAFPDGTLYADLRGYDLRARKTPEQVLGGFLHALDIAPTRIPVELEARAALFRTLLASKRVLLVLDNVATADQVRHLLPAADRSLVLVTSRSRLSGLVARDGAARMTVDHLTPEESLRLLAEIVGAERVAAGEHAARQLTELCDQLPLALRIVAERAVTHPHHTLADLVDELSDERARLDALALDEDELTAVRTVFSWSYGALAPAVARTFRLLAVHPSPHFSTSAVAALTGASPAAAGRALDSLSGLHLIEQRARHRYRLHDLLRSYALERVVEEETNALRDAATDRVLSWYLRTAHAASRLILPQGRELALPAPVYGPEGTEGGAGGAEFESLESALQWCEDERQTLLDAVNQAHSLGKHEIAWKLPVALMGFFERRSYWDDWISTHLTGLRSARSAGDRFGEGWLALSLADAYWDTRRTETALSYFGQALDATRDTGDEWGEGFSLRGMSIAQLALGRHESALDYSRQARRVFARIGERRGEGMCHLSIGQAQQGLGRLAEAVACYRRALAVFDELGNEWSTALTTFHLGTALQLRGAREESVEQHAAAAAAFRRLGDRRHEAVVLHSLGDLYAAAGESTRALEGWQGACHLFEELGDLQAEEVRSKIAALGTA